MMIFIHLVLAAGSLLRAVSLSTQQHALTARHPCDGAVTEEDAVECAQRTLEEILSNQQQAAAADTTKEEHCADEAKRLQVSIKDAQRALKAKEAALESARYEEATCGCCCDAYWTIRSRKLSIEQDVSYQEDRIQNLEEQVEHLNNWCSV
jgi:hypothetical protein